MTTPYYQKDGLTLYNCDCYSPGGCSGSCTHHEPEPCPVCSQPMTWVHDHKPDLSGLDDGPYLPGHESRKKPAPKSPEELTEIRTRAWVTRRAKYGQHGHR